MIWLTSADTFAPRNHYALQSIFKHTPCAVVYVFTDSLPRSFFQQYIQRDYALQILSLESIRSAVCDSFETGEKMPRVGCTWFEKFATRSGPYKDVHLSDVFRLFQLYHYGGSYVDFDHIFLAPTFDEETFGRNVLGTEICKSDNPDCLNHQHLKHHDSVSLKGAKVYSKGRGTFSDDDAVSYTPCNGVMLNWEARHWLLREALLTADREYDPQCWGCLGPRMLGQILKSKRGRYRITLLAPGIIYGFDYTVAPLATSEVLAPSEVYFEKSTGIHLYGKVTSEMDIHHNSTFGLAIARNALITQLDLRASKSTPVARSDKKLIAFAFAFDTLPEGDQEFRELAERMNGVLICHSDWLGIREATEKISQRTGLPIIFLQSSSHHMTLYQFLRSLNVRFVHFQGGPPLMQQFINHNVHQQQLTISVTYHSGVGVHNTNPSEATLLLELFKLSISRHICLFFLETDQALYAKTLGASASVVGVPALQELSARVLNPTTDSSSPYKIGLLGAETRFTVKNFWPQISAACMLAHVEIHITGRDRAYFDWLVEKTPLNFCRGTIIQHAHLSPTAFRWLIAQMDINMYISITEAAPNVVIDSLSAGVPVLVSDTTELLDTSELLRHVLIVNRIDDPVTIRDALIKAFQFSIEHRITFQSEITKAVLEYDRRAIAQWSAVLRAMSAHRCG